LHAPGGSNGLPLSKKAAVDEPAAEPPR
jgi:hypothetical protein